MSFPRVNSASGHRESSATGSKCSVLSCGMCWTALIAVEQASSNKILSNSTHRLHICNMYLTNILKQYSQSKDRLATKAREAHR